MQNYTVPALFLALSLFLSLHVGARDYLDQLKNGTIEEKIEAMHHLGYSRSKQAFWYYVKYLNFNPAERESSRTIQCRAAAAKALGRMRDDRAVFHLIERWEKEQNPVVQTQIMYAFSYYRDDSIADIIAEGLSSENENIVFQSLLTSARYRDPVLTEKVRPLFDDSDDGIIKTAAAYAMAVLAEEQQDTYIEYLSDSLDDVSPWRRYWSIRFVTEARIISLLPEIEDLLEIENRNWIRRQGERAVVILRNEKRRKKKLSENKVYENIVN